MTPERRTIWDRLDDGINPIVVKELRQAVQSRFVVAVLILFLLIQLVYIGVYLLSSGIGGHLDTVDFREGRTVFNVLQIILLATCMLFLPLYTAARLSAERAEANTDLLFITTIKPRSIIAGKIISAMILAMLIFSSCIPFMALTFYLRGIDWLTILFVLGIDLLVILAGVQLMIFVAVIPAHMVFKVILGFGGLVMLVYMFAGALAASSYLLLWAGLTTLMSDTDFWLTVASIVLGTLSVCGLFFVWSVAILSPSSSNRALPVRVYLVGLWGVTFAVAIAISHQINDLWPLIFWVSMMALLAGQNIVIAINERRSWSPRVARTIPSRLLPRMLAFLFYGGAAGGVLFSILMAAATALGIFVAVELSSQFWPALAATLSDWEFQYMLGVLLLSLYLYAYSMSAVFLQSLMPSAVRPIFTWLALLLLLAFGSVVPYLASYFILMDRWNYDSHAIFLVTNPFAAAWPFFENYRSREDHRQMFMLFVVGWSILITAMNVPWIVAQWRRFRRTVDGPPVKVPAVISPTVAVEAAP